MTDEPVWCRLRPPPLPEPSAPQYSEVLRFIHSDRKRKEILESYYDDCGGNFPLTTPDIGRTTNMAEASAGTIAGIIFAVLVGCAAVFIVVFYIWKRKRKQKQQSYDPEKKQEAMTSKVDSTVSDGGSYSGISASGYRLGQSSNALKLDEYENTNYLHNQAVKSKPYDSSSVEEGNIECKTNGTTIPEKGNGDVPENDDTRVKKLKRKSKDSACIEKGAVNECYAADEMEQPPSPDTKSVKSDTPLIDSIDGMLLPNQASTEGSKTETIVEVKNNSSYGSTNTSVVHKGGRLPPLTFDTKVTSCETNGLAVESRPKKSPKKKKGVISGLKLRASEPCQNTNAGLTEDLADNRKSV